MPTAPARSLRAGSPADKLAALASTAPPGSASAFEPSETDYALAGALFTSNAKSLLELARSAGISDTTLLRVRQNPARIAWIVSKGAEIAELGKGAVYARLIDKALTSDNPVWLKLYLERFDEIYRKANPGATHNTQVNVYGSYSDAELRALIQQKARQVFGGSTSEGNEITH